MDELSSEDHPDWWRPMGGQNSQDSILERRSLVWNDNEITAGAPPEEYVNTEYKGKFFPRGMRGMIEEIQIYAQGLVPNNELILRYAPYPGSGPYGEVTITTDAGWSWDAGTIEEMWNYDGIFIWVSDCDTSTRFGYDLVQPYDAHESSDNGATWEALNQRIFIRVVYTGETPGDVPVSGTLNTIEVPSVAARVAAAGNIAVDDGALVDLCTAHGAGTLLRATWGGRPATAPNHHTVWYEMQIHTEEGLAYVVTNMDLTQDPIALRGRSSEGEFYIFTIAEVDYFIMNLRVPIKFRRTVRLRVINHTGVNMICEGYLFANMQR